MCLEERGRGELNIKGDKGIKNTFSTQQSAKCLKYKHGRHQLFTCLCYQSFVLCVHWYNLAVLKEVSRQST